MSNNIVVLSGSPRKGGNTDTLAAAFVDGAKSAGKQVTVFRVADMKIGGCLGCGHCFEEPGVCVQKDDMAQILEALKTADAFVLASPVYFWGVTAQLKLAIDRTYAQLRAKAPIKRAAMLLTCGSRVGATELMFQTMCEFSKWENAGIIVETGLHAPDAIKGRDVLEKAKALGQEI
jgi:multimeric flavodoxin WrbA